MAGWGGKGSKPNFPIGRWTAQIRDVQSCTGTDFNDKSITVQQFKWGIDWWDGSKWISATIYTKQNFADPSTFDNPQFIPKLCKLVHACGDPLPRSPQEAAAWSPDQLIGKQFIIEVTQNEMNGKTVEEFRRKPQATPEAAPEPVAAGAPAPSPAPTAAPAPAMAGAGAGVTASSDAWA